MNPEKISIETNRLQIRSFSKEDVTTRYVEWLNDPQINQYLEVRHAQQTFDSVCEWVETTNKIPARMLLGVYFDETHVGNITFCQIEPAHKCLRVGICLGVKSMHGQGYGLEMIEGAVSYIFDKMGFNRIEAGLYCDNIASQRLFSAAGFRQEAVFRERLQCKGKFCDMLLFVLLKKKWLTERRDNKKDDNRI